MYQSEDTNKLLLMGLVLAVVRMQDFPCWGKDGRLFEVEMSGSAVRWTWHFLLKKMWDVGSVFR